MSDLEEKKDKDFETAQRTTKGDASVVDAALERADDRELFDWISDLSGTSPLRVAIHRESPRFHAGKQVSGHLNTFDRPLEQDEIKEMYGGGKYLIRVHVHDQNTNKMKYKTSRRVEIAGDPLIPKSADSATPTVAAAPVESDSLAKAALDTMKNIADTATKRQQQLEDAARKTGTDPAIITLIGEMGKASQAQFDTLLKLMDRPQRETTEDKLVAKLVDNDNVRITSLRTQHESEMRVVRENAQADLRRVEERYDRASAEMTKVHDREVDNLRRNYEHQIATLQLTHTSVVEGLKREIAHLDRELTTTRTELGTLRGQKDKPMLEQLTELATLKETMQEVFGGGDDEGKSAIEQAVEAFVPIAKGIGDRIANTPGAAAPPPAMPRRAPQQQRRTVIRPNGQQQRAPQAQGPQQPGGPPVPTGPQQPQAQPQQIMLNPNEVALAVSYIENALRAGTTAEEFAQSFRALVPGDIVKAIRAVGVDNFLDQIQVPPGSPLDTVEGRQFVKDVIKALSPPSAAAAPPPAAAPAA